MKKLKSVLSYLYRLIYNKLVYNITGEVKILSPLKITPRYITFGKNVFIFNNARIEGVSRYNNQAFTPSIIIKDGVTIQQNLHLTCANSVTIGENTAIAPFVTITDIHHSYTDIHIPIEKQDLEVSSVWIGKDCKIHNNSVILPGCRIGDHVVIGANSVVNRNIPSYSVAVGAPAKIVKRYNPENGKWEKTNPDGSFKNSG